MKNASVVVTVLTVSATLTALTSCSDDKEPSPGNVASLAGDPMGGGDSAMMPGQSAGAAPGPAMAMAGPGATEGPPASVSLQGPAGPGDMPGAGQPRPPLMVVACDESSVGGSSPNTLSVNVSAAQQPVGKELFGVLMETLGRDVNGGLYVGRTSPIPNTDGLRDDIVQGFAEAGVGIVQWPGGCAANNYNWAPNTNPTNTMGTDLFMQFVQTIGAEPYLTGRPNAANAQSNADWVRYINDNPEHPEWNLKYFKVGNEVWGCGGNQVQATYETNYNANYALLSQPVNGKPLYIVAGTDLIGRNNNAWMDTMIPNLGGRMDGVEIHDYLYFPDSIPNVGFSDAQYYDIVNRANRGQIGPRIEQLVSILDRRDPEKKIKIVEDEWGDWLLGFNEAQDAWTQQGTVMDAVSAAEHLHLFMSHADRIQAAALAQPINVIHSLFVTRASDGALVKTSTFYVFKMFAPHHTANARWAPNTLNSENIQGNNTSFPVLSSGATVDDTGGVNISLVNVDLVNSRSVDIKLDTDTTSYVVSSAQVITGDAKDAFNDFGQPERVNAQPLAASSFQACGRSLSVDLPPKSVVMFRLELVPPQ
jgi:alpha-N-arabinofuranosidase